MNLILFLYSNPHYFYMLAGVLGLLIGSFLNVVIHRIPVMLERDWRNDCCQLLDINNTSTTSGTYNLVIPRSTCPHCGHAISPMENIPVLSFLVLGGKCKACRNSISIRYPLIELLSCILTVMVAITFGITFQALFAAMLTWSLIALTVIDYDTQLLPDNITLPFLWLGIICNIFGLFTDIYSSLFGAIFGYLVLWAVYITFKLVTGKEGMGYGDFKLLALLGAWLGWQMLPLVIIVSSLLGSVVGLGFILFRNHSMAKPIPFGPFLASAGWIALIYGHTINAWYLDWASTPL